MSDVNTMYERTLENFRNSRSGRIRRQVKNVLKLIEVSSQQKILEVGVATGKFTSIMSRTNNVFVIDISTENLKRAAGAVMDMGNSANAVFIAADCAAIPFADSSFDKIVAIDIIEHLTDKIFDMLCSEAYRVLRPGGCAYFYTPNLLHPYELARPFRPIMRSEHIGVRARSKICRFLKRRGFHIEKSYFNNLFRRISVKARKA